MSINYEQLDDNDPIYNKIIDEYISKTEKYRKKLDIEYIAECLKVSHDLNKKYDVFNENDYLLYQEANEYRHYNDKISKELIKEALKLLEQRYNLKPSMIDLDKKKLYFDTNTK